MSHTCKFFEPPRGALLARGEFKGLHAGPRAKVAISLHRWPLTHFMLFLESLLYDPHHPHLDKYPPHQSHLTILAAGKVFEFLDEWGKMLFDRYWETLLPNGAEDLDEDVREGIILQVASGID